MSDSEQREDETYEQWLERRMGEISAECDALRALLSGRARWQEIERLQAENKALKERLAEDHKSCVHCASERISQVSFDVWKCRDCGREFVIR